MCAAAEAGIPVLAGADAGMVPHGRLATEVELLIAAGLSPEAALGAASWDARAWLRLPPDRGGRSRRPGRLPADPRLDPGTLRGPGVMVLDGRLVAKRDRS